MLPLSYKYMHTSNQYATWKCYYFSLRQGTVVMLPLALTLPLVLVAVLDWNRLATPDRAPAIPLSTAHQRTTSAPASLNQRLVC